MADRFQDLRGSWYSQAPGWVDKQDRPGSNALGVPDEMQGIALPSREGLGKWYDVEAPNGQIYRLQQTDIGPARWTGRGVDISAAAASQMGYTPKTFPTDAPFRIRPAEGPGASGSPGGLPVQAQDLGSVPSSAPPGPAQMIRAQSLSDIPGQRPKVDFGALGLGSSPFSVPEAPMPRPSSDLAMPPMQQLAMQQSLLSRYGR